MALVPRVTHGMGGADADDLGFDEQRVFKHGRCGVGLVAGVVRVHEQEGAGLQLAVHATRRLVDKGASACAGDQRHGDTRRLDQRAGAAYGLHHVLDRFRTGRRAAQVLGFAVVRLQARKVQPGVPLYFLRQRHGGGAGLHTTAVLADVDFDKHPHGGLCLVQRSRQPPNAFHAVHCNGNVAVFGL